MATVFSVGTSQNGEGSVMCLVLFCCETECWHRLKRVHTSEKLYPVKGNKNSYRKTNKKTFDLVFTDLCSGLEGTRAKGAGHIRSLLGLYL